MKPNVPIIAPIAISLTNETKNEYNILEKEITLRGGNNFDILKGVVLIVRLYVYLSFIYRFSYHRLLSL